jgi:GAF domain-containing protein
VRYAPGHPALQAVERLGSVRASAGAEGTPGEWAERRQWPKEAAHALCTVLRSRGRTLGVLTFLRGAARPAFERPDAVYAESVAVLTASALDLAQSTGD